jgi:hypothetical protein
VTRKRSRIEYKAPKFSHHVFLATLNLWLYVDGPPRDRFTYSSCFYYTCTGAVEYLLWMQAFERSEKIYKSMQPIPCNYKASGEISPSVWRSNALIMLKVDLASSPNSDWVSIVS